MIRYLDICTNIYIYIFVFRCLFVRSFVHEKSHTLVLQLVFLISVSVETETWRKVTSAIWDFWKEFSTARSGNKRGPGTLETRYNFEPGRLICSLVLIPKHSFPCFSLYSFSLSLSLTLFRCWTTWNLKTFN